jgi:hypothetical protein
MFDAIYDFKRMNPTGGHAASVADPCHLPGRPGCGKDQSFLMSVRQSSLGCARSFRRPQGCSRPT